MVNNTFSYSSLTSSPSRWYLPRLTLLVYLSFGCESFQIGTSFLARKQPTINPTIFRRDGGIAKVASAVLKMAIGPNADEPLAKKDNMDVEIGILVSISKNRVALEKYVRECDELLLRSDDKEIRLLLDLKYYAQYYLEKLPPPTPSTRIAPISFGVESEELIHDYDLSRILDYVLRLFDWHTDPKIQKKFVAPYFPLVQSSGSGKTKLLWELQKLINNSGNKNFSQYTCRTILCVDSDPKDGATSSIFSTHLTIGRDSFSIRDRIWEKLDELFKQCEQDKIIFLFDEAQHLLLYDGYAFKCLRWWLRRNRYGVQKKVVAVFAGTTLQLTNAYAEPRQSSTSRDASNYHHDEGTVLYDPFFSLFTTGIFAAGVSKDSGVNEYERAIPYGRPLFAAVSKSKQMDESELSDVLNRMLLVKTPDPSISWDKNLAACFSILGTRVQVGQTSSAALVSELISLGYGWLTHFAVPPDGSEPTSPRICFKPDPVCARLAMCMMDPDWSTTSSTGSNLHGKGKRFWTRKISEIISTGLCLPNQGGVGEIAGASYLLFCGDELRRRIDPNYKTFSVPLEGFVAALLQKKLDVLSLTSTERSASSNKKKKLVYADAHVSFIQVVRNYLRFPIEDLEGLGILEAMYNAGIAYYSYPNCPGFDMVASIRLTKLDGTFRFIPMIVSISTTKEGQAINSATLESMTDALNKTNMSMAIRLVFDETHNNATELLSMEDTTRLLRGESVSKVLVVPRNDQFGIAKLLLETVSDGPVRNEIDSSDFFTLSPTLQGGGYDHEPLLRANADLREHKNYLKESIDKDFGSSQNRKPRRGKGSLQVASAKPVVQGKIGGKRLNSTKKQPSKSAETKKETF